MRASIIIPAFNEGNLLTKTVSSIVESARLLEYELIVVDDASWDGSVVSLQKEHPRVRILRTAERLGASPAKDFGAQQSHGDTLIFIDAHSSLEAGAIEQLVDNVEKAAGRAIFVPTIAPLDPDSWKPRRGGKVGHGYKLDLESLDASWLTIDQLKRAPGPQNRFYEIPSLPGFCFSISRNLYDRLGGFDPRILDWGPDDLDLGLRGWLMGAPLLHDPQITVAHYFPDTLPYEVIPERTLANHLRLARKNFTDAVWEEWLRRHAESDRASTPAGGPPEGIWARAWQLFEQDRSSVEQQRALLMARRSHDEFWYAKTFDLNWPMLADSRAATKRPTASPKTATSTPIPDKDKAHLLAASNARPQFVGGMGQSQDEPPIPEDEDKPCDPYCEGCKEFSNGPIRYSSGQIALAFTDLLAPGFGMPIALTRSYANRLEYSFDFAFGYNWVPHSLPYIGKITLHSEDAGFVVVGSANTAIWFDIAGGDFVARFGGKETLTLDSEAMIFTLTETDGNVTQFRALGLEVAHAGVFYQTTAPGGQLLRAERVDDIGRVTQLTRSVDVSGTTLTEEIVFDYSSERVQYATLRRKSGNGAWTAIRRVAYEYYADEEDFGTAGCLKTVVQQDWNGSVWVDIGTDYYRYYLGDEEAGFAGALKYALGNEAFERLSDAVADPFEATNSQVAEFANYYFEYDEQQRCTKEKVFGAACGTSGEGTFSFEYTASENDSGVNSWKMKTVETRPDDSQAVVYTNKDGMNMLRALTDGENSWIDYWQYDDASRVILHANPSAVVAYDDGEADLGVELKSNDGKIEISHYYVDDGDGGVKGYLQSTSLECGTEGTAIKLTELTYAPHTAGIATVFPISKETVYTIDDNTTHVDTNHSYTYYEGTAQVKERTTTFPVVSTEQNGSNIANVRKSYFNLHNFEIWTQDERGVITRTLYDVVTGAVTQRVMDVNTTKTLGAPSGWETLAGFGMNLISDFESDTLGRHTQELGPVHSVDFDGVPSRIRTATWTIYKDAAHERYSGIGYQSGVPGSFQYTLVNPVQIARFDFSNRVTDEISATRASTSGRLAPTDVFPQSTWVRRASTHYSDHCLLDYRRVYHTIPHSGDGSAVTHYDQTNFGYNIMGRQNRVRTPGGTITRTVFDVRGLPVGIYVGTNDTGATDNDPTNGGDDGNNLVKVTTRVYDDDAAGGDGNLTLLVQHVDGNSDHDRHTVFAHDWRDRQIVNDGELDCYEVASYDNLDRQVRLDRRNTSAEGNLIARTETTYDSRGRVFLVAKYGVDPSSGELGNALFASTWYDAVGNPIKEQRPGGRSYTKRQLDGVGRVKKSFLCFGDDGSHSNAVTVANDIVVSQSEFLYNAAGGLIQRTERSRYHDATGEGELTNPKGSQPRARVLYTAMWPDAVGRLVVSANYGTFGGADFLRGDIAPARTDSILVTSTRYNARGEADRAIDPVGREDRLKYDDAGRVVHSIVNYVVGPSGADQGQFLELSYNADGNVQSTTARNGSAGYQHTNYIYGTTLLDGDICSSILLRARAYPDSSGDADRISYSYNRQSQATSRIDQRGVERRFDYDLLGRQTQDRATTIPEGVSATIRRVETSYDVRGIVEFVSCFDNPAVGEGTTVNQVRYILDLFGRPVAEYQSHSGEVNTDTTPAVGYTYTDGLDNVDRLLALAYPNGRVVDIDYGTSGTADDILNRVNAISEDSTDIARYSYLGLATIAHRELPMISAWQTLVTGPETNPYAALDRFDRLHELIWQGDGTLLRILYDYNRLGNRTTRLESLDPNRAHDELYSHDGLDRLKQFQRGRLNAKQNGMKSVNFAQSWSLDALGNWTLYKQDDSGLGWTLEQSRSFSLANEIIAIAETVGPSWAEPVYDEAGNMIGVPVPADMSSRYTALYDAWNHLVALSANGDSFDFDYDGLHRLTVCRKRFGGSFDESRHSYYSKTWQLLEERVDESNAASRQYVWGVQYTDDLVLRDRDANGDGSLDERYFALADGNQNIVALIDQEGVVVERFAYDAYGRVRVLDASFGPLAASAFDWEVLFASYRYLTDLGLYLARHRLVHPLLGCWVTRDPAGYVNMNHNLYCYVDCRPLASIDPDGMEEWNVTIARAGGFLSGLYQGASNLVTGAAQGLYDIPAGAVDVLGYTGDAASTYFGYPLNYQPFSYQAAGYDPVNGRPWYQESAIRGTRTAAATLSRGASEAMIGWYDLYQTNDVNAYGRQMGGLALQRVTSGVIKRYAPDGSVQIGVRSGGGPISSHLNPWNYNWFYGAAGKSQGWWSQGTPRVGQRPLVAGPIGPYISFPALRPTSTARFGLGDGSPGPVNPRANCMTSAFEGFLRGVPYVNTALPIAPEPLSNQPQSDFQRIQVRRSD